MGTGKSSIGKLLSKKLQWKYVDTDSLIEKSAGMSIREIFTTQGESRFRDMESAILENVLAKDHQVISTGGGIVLRENNINRMKVNGAIICLTTTPEIIFERTHHKSSRPILGENPTFEKIKELLNQRAPFYNKDDWTIDTSKLTKTQVTDKILDIIKSNT
jgi:shikimate kinase